MTSFVFSSTVVPYSAAIADAGKQAFPVAPPFDMTLFSLLDKSLVAELQAALRKTQDIVTVLSGRAPRLSKMTREFVAAKEANTHVELHVRQLKEADAGNKEALATSQKGHEAAKQKMKLRSWRGARCHQPLRGVANSSRGSG